MRRPNQHLVTSALVGVMAAGLPGCELLEGGTAGTAPAGGALAEAQRAVDPAVGQTLTAVAAVGAAGLAFERAVADESDVLGAAAGLEAAADGLAQAAVTLEAAEDGVAGSGPQAAGQITRPLAVVVGIGLVLYGTWKFAQRLKDLAHDAREAAEDRDDALVGLANGQEGAIEAYEDADRRLEAASEGAIEEVGTRVTTELVLAPVRPVSVGGVILKDRAGEALQSGLKVLGATEECGAQPDGPGCRIAAQRTDDRGRVTLPTGRVTVVVSGPERVRAVTQVDVVEGQDTAVEVHLAPIGAAGGSDAGPALDAGVAPDGGVDPDLGGPPPELSPLAGGFFGVARREGAVDVYLLGEVGPGAFGLRYDRTLASGEIERAWLCGALGGRPPVALGTVDCGWGGEVRGEAFVLLSDPASCGALEAGEAFGRVVAMVSLGDASGCFVSPYYDPEAVP
ncbi:MAG: hypothetical protein H6702_23140 [Myxococcales bacterium]|nr:hypothetical protein [Myxococcales bacterium]